MQNRKVNLRKGKGDSRPSLSHSILVMSPVLLYVHNLAHKSEICAKGQPVSVYVEANTHASGLASSWAR
eukprot:1338631-Amorphochlora_amoeboformis.AAC.2